MRAVLAIVVALATATGCYARSPSGGSGTPLARTTQQAPDLANQRPDTNQLPTAQR